MKRQYLSIQVSTLLLLIAHRSIKAHVATYPFLYLEYDSLLPLSYEAPILWIFFYMFLSHLRKSFLFYSYPNGLCKGVEKCIDCWKLPWNFFKKKKIWGKLENLGVKYIGASFRKWCWSFQTLGWEHLSWLLVGSSENMSTLSKTKTRKIEFRWKKKDFLDSRIGRLLQHYELWRMLPGRHYRSFSCCLYCPSFSSQVLLVDEILPRLGVLRALSSVFKRGRREDSISLSNHYLGPCQGIT